MKGILASLLLLAGNATFAQQAVETGQGVGAVLRAIDTLNGDVQDLTLSLDETRRFGRIDITLHQCRYPAANPFDDAFAQVDIVDTREGVAGFSGWMLASSPALNALEHPRYDVWVISCITES